MFYLVSKTPHTLCALARGYFVTNLSCIMADKIIDPIRQFAVECFERLCKKHRENILTFKLPFSKVSSSVNYGASTYWPPAKLRSAEHHCTYPPIKL
eukprot:sb/3479049/